MQPDTVPLTGWLTHMLKTLHRPGRSSTATITTASGGDEAEAEADADAEAEAGTNTEIEAKVVVDVGVVGSVVLYPTGVIQHAGYEYKKTPLPNHGGVIQTTALLPTDRLRGYQMTDARLTQQQAVMGVSRACLLVRRDLFERLGGFHTDSDTYPETYTDTHSDPYADADLCLRALTGTTTTTTTITPTRVAIAPGSVVVAANTHPYNDPHSELDTAYTATKFNIMRSEAVGPGGSGGLEGLEGGSGGGSRGGVKEGSRHAFSMRWEAYLEAMYMSHLSEPSVQTQTQPQPQTDNESESRIELSWIIHCGGSQGLEAGVIMQELDAMVCTRAYYIPR